MARSKMKYPTCGYEQQRQNSDFWRHLLGEILLLSSQTLIQLIRLLIALHFPIKKCVQFKDTVF